MSVTEHIAEGTARFLKNENIIDKMFEDFFRKTIREELDKYFREKYSTCPVRYRPPLFVEINGIRLEFDPEIFTSGKIHITLPKDTELTGQCQEGYLQVYKNGLMYCELIDKKSINTQKKNE